MKYREGGNREAKLFSLSLSLCVTKRQSKEMHVNFVWQVVDWMFVKLDKKEEGGGARETTDFPFLFFFLFSSRTLR